MSDEATDEKRFEINKEITEIRVHPLTANPDECYNAEQSNERYKDLRTEVVDTFHTEKNGDCIRFVCISDTHNKTDNLYDMLPDGDVLIHAGDFTGSSTKKQIIHFNKFLGKAKAKFKHIVVIAGNHEITFDQTWDNGGQGISKFPIFFGAKPKKMLNFMQSGELLTNCTYIEEESIELYGIKIYGSPWQPEFCDLGFNAERGEPLLKIWEKIPTDTDILVTHGPPLGIGDRCVRGNRVGCAELLSTVMDRVRPSYHIFGHIHEDYGIWNDGVTTYINASTCNYRQMPVNLPVVFDYEINTS